MSALMFQNFEDWVALATPTNPRPVYDPVHPTSADIERILEYNGRLSMVATHDTHLIAEAIQRTQRRNERALASSGQCVLITGNPLDGKTHGAVAFAARQCRDAWQEREPFPGPGRNLLAPWGYLEVEAGHGLKGMAASLLRFIGAPIPTRGTGNDYLYQLRKLLPAVGMRGVIIDDAHGIVGANNAQSRTFAGALKAMLTGLPVTLVIIGVHLETSALAGPRGGEVRMRGDLVKTGSWPTPFSSKEPGPWERLAVNLSDLVEVPGHPAATGMRTRTFVETLARGSRGRPGLAIQWVKEAAEHAITHQMPLDAAALAATADFPRQRLAVVGEGDHT